MVGGYNAASIVFFMRHTFVYMVRCSDGSLFTGVAPDSERIISDLNGKSGGAYVKSRLPVFLVFTEEYMNESDAVRRAAAIKRMNRRDKEHLLVSVASGFVGGLGLAT